MKADSMVAIVRQTIDEDLDSVLACLSRVLPCVGGSISKGFYNGFFKPAADQVVPCTSSGELGPTRGDDSDAFFSWESSGANFEDPTPCFCFIF